jgi:hypothetical protein
LCLHRIDARQIRARSSKIRHDAIRPTRVGIGGHDETGRFELADLLCTCCDSFIASRHRPVKSFGTTAAEK